MFKKIQPTHHQIPTTLVATRWTELVTRIRNSKSNSISKLSLYRYQKITIVKVNNATARVQTKKVTTVPNGKFL